MHSMFLHLLGVAMIYLGSFFLLTASVGILRFPDFYTRLHPSGVGDLLGMPFILLGVAFYNYSFFVFAKVLLIILITWVTSSTSCQAISGASYRAGLDPFLNNVNNDDR